MGAPIQDGQYAALPNGIRLHYASAGEKGRPLVLFVHGFPEFWYEWEAQLAEFGGDFFAVAPDLRGFNLSDMPSDLAQYKAKHIVEDLRLLAAHLGYERFVMVAHDWGGAIAWNFAIALPQLLHKLIIVNSPHPYLFAQALANDPEQQAASEYMNWLRAEGSESALAKDEFKLLEGLLNGMGRSPTPWFTPEVRARYHECWARGLTGGVNYYRASPLHPPTKDHAGPNRLQLDPSDFIVRIPTRVIWGEQDIALPKSLINGLDGLIGDLKIERIPEGTHWVIHEQPERVNRLIRGFLSE
ncbi:alpha/beta fold hydrolase [Noviherbaspirillum denitrificans]|uniref:Alpha/beta hydrolase n=1 Tax=Noviherbaspirillum denitrificans TaxID=1968433 RepID=A0A254TJY5_9BURK|nr:alpha/beta hydrolase [Noviherbaspirillum denitrificans]OWW20018.1 alpha/beta hydrolase [Noviherbaspirillum denitrificans]